MIRTLLVILFLLFTFSWQSMSHTQIKQDGITVLTYNIRYNNPDDGPNAWPSRRDLVTGLIRKQHVEIFGLQEALISQVRDIENAFPGFGRIGVGRDDGKDSGEFSSVFYDKKHISVIISGTFWLSQTPSVAGSRGWDAACNRIVTWARLKEIKTGKSFFYFNTHFDHEGEVARRNSALLVLHAIDSIAGKYPVILTGDFNAVPDAEPIRILTDKSDPTCMLDSRVISAHLTGPAYTYTGFEVGVLPGERIDYVFVKHVSKVISQRVLNDHQGKYYASDHLPVVVHLAF